VPVTPDPLATLVSDFNRLRVSVFLAVLDDDDDEDATFEAKSRGFLCPSFEFEVNDSEKAGLPTPFALLPPDDFFLDSLAGRAGNS